MERHFVHVLRETVEHDQLAAGELIHNKAAHVGVVSEERRRVREHKFLIDRPVFRHVVVQRFQLPHAVVLDEHTGSAVLFREDVKRFARQLVFVLNVFHIDVLHVGAGLVVLRLAFLADEQQGTLPVIETLIRKRFVYKRGLA